MKYGLSEHEAKEIIQQELDKNPDLKYYINNPYLEELITLLIDGISKAIAKNNEEVIKEPETAARAFSFMQSATSMAKKARCLAGVSPCTAF